MYFFYSFGIPHRESGFDYHIVYNEMFFGGRGGDPSDSDCYYPCCTVTVQAFMILAIKTHLIQIVITLVAQ